MGTTLDRGALQLACGLFSLPRPRMGMVLRVRRLRHGTDDARGLPVFQLGDSTGYPLAAYPSTDGLATKYVSNIDIYTTEVPSWTLQLDGTAIGGANFTMTQQFFAEGVAHHGAATWNDSRLGR